MAGAVLEALRFARDKAGLARLILDRHRVPYRIPEPDHRLVAVPDLRRTDGPDLAADAYAVLSAVAPPFGRRGDGADR